MIPIDEYGRHGRPEVSPAIEIDQGARWDEMYREKPSDRLSWFQEHPSLSLHLITDAAPNRDARIIDVGGGDSLLVDHLLERGYRHITVLDISGSAIERTQSRLGSRADPVRWVVGDVLTTGEIGMYDVWHDRALFHFLIEPQQRQQYVEAVTRTVVPQGPSSSPPLPPTGHRGAVVWGSVVTTSGAWQPSSESRSLSSRQCVRRTLPRGMWSSSSPMPLSGSSLAPAPACPACVEAPRSCSDVNLAAAEEARASRAHITSALVTPGSGDELCIADAAAKLR